MSQPLKLPRSTPEEQGIRSSAIQEFLDAMDKQRIEEHELHSFMLLRNGHVVAEGWWPPYGPDLPHKLFSLSKSFTAAAIGLLADEGAVSLEDAVISFFPDDLPPDVEENLALMKIKHLLAMSTGHAQDTLDAIYAREDGNWVKEFLRLPVEHEPGSRFVYNSGATYMLSAIVQNRTGQTLLAYLEPRLFAPLGIEGAAWEKCPRGINTGGFGLNLRTEDIAKFGQLYLQKGVWNDRRILSSSWVEEASSRQISNGTDPNNDWEQGYGYQFWRCRHDGFRGDGAFGQFCLVIPDRNAVVAMTSASLDMQAILNLVWKHLLPAMGDAPQAADTTAQSALAEKLSSLALFPAGSQWESPLSAGLSGKQYVLEPNEENIHFIAFAFEKDVCILSQWGKSGERRITCGSRQWVENRIALPRSVLLHNGYGKWADTPNPSWEKSCLIAVSGAWSDEHTFVMTQRFIETPFYYTTTYRFKDDLLSIQTRANVSFQERGHPPMHGKRIG